MPIHVAKDTSIWSGHNQTFNGWGEKVDDNTATKIGPGGSN